MKKLARTNNNRIVDLAKDKTNKHARDSTIIRELADKVQLLAFSLGINANIAVGNHESGTVEFIVLFSTKHITEKRKNILLMHKENREALKKFTVSTRAYSKDIIPFNEAIYRIILKHNKGQLIGHQMGRFRKSFNRGYIARDNFIPHYHVPVKSTYGILYDINKQYEFIEEIIQEIA